jgi:serum/glucocorticoid-regulated kinase 2
LGRGTYGKVMLVEKKDNRKCYAMKTLRKKYIIDENQIEHTMTERKILQKVKHPFLVGLDYVCILFLFPKISKAFQTPEKLFLVM